MGIWKDIEGFEGLYKISNLGNVYSVKRKVFLKKRLGKGYERVNLYNENGLQTKQVHRLVAEAFIPNEDNKPQVNHKDGNKQNNLADNLEWATPKENTIHAHSTGLAKPNYNQKTSIKIDQFNAKTGEFVAKWKSINEVARELGFDISAIHRCILGKVKTHKGFIWKRSVL